MDSSISYNDDEHIESHLSKAQCLEMAYQETLRNTDMIIKDEGARRLRLQILMLENENDDLHEQLALGDDRIDVLEQESEELRGLLEQAQEDVCRQETEIRAQTRELQTLKAELTSMNGITTDTTKVLTEKLSLARELATLRPELEHLRSQASYQQTVLAEKLALQRQVSTLEVELETEKRVSKRAAQKSRNSDVEIELQNELDRLQKDLAREKREREKARKEAEADHQYQVEELQKELAQEKRAREKNRKESEIDLLDRLEELQKDFAREKRDGEKARKEAEKELKLSETRMSVLESKLDQFRTKLRATKDQLKECQTELSQARAMAKAGPAASRGDAATKNPRKRGALEMSTDVEIGTPDGVAMRGKRPVTKRSRMDQTMVGEKSMFSITPFLNRTISMAPETPDKEAEPEAGRKEYQEATTEPTTQAVREQPPTSQVDPSPTAAPKPRGKKKAAESAPAAGSKVLGEAGASNRNKKATVKKPRVLSTLESVNEEDGDENDVPEFVPAAVKGPIIFKAGQVQLKHTDAEENGPKKKKRKLLGGGKTLFDEEDGEATKRPAKVSLGPPRLLGKGGLAGPKGGLKGGLSTVGGFGGFSPLKKDRRGVGASFLA
ncbi:hypothetical protein N431DRAFT_329548 [Stipitochalara longipes BDJ]|nr:hypothetical protein N431DRAFT_329548 [Stipitochalara longipes BDJ]